MTISSKICTCILVVAALAYPSGYGPQSSELRISESANYQKSTVQSVEPISKTGLKKSASLGFDLPEEIERTTYAKKLDQIAVPITKTDGKNLADTARVSGEDAKPIQALKRVPTHNPAPALMVDAPLKTNPIVPTIRDKEAIFTVPKIPPAVTHHQVAELERPKLVGEFLSVPADDRLTIRQKRVNKTYQNVRARPRGLFNTLELEFDDPTKLGSWASVMPSVQQDKQRFKTCLDFDNRCGSDSLSHWARGLKDWKGRPTRDVIYQVNSRVNSLNYRADQTSNGKFDKWLAPRQFLLTGGDCEDFALLKMASLSALGVADDDMRIVVGVLRDGRAHAVLNVSLDGKQYILDNRRSEVLMAEAETFTPKYSVNFDKRWTHIQRPSPVLYAHNNAE